jgi:predicted TIM-barrel fold metal-dependent hydrolase
MTSRREFLCSSTLALSAAGLASVSRWASAFAGSASDRISISESFVTPQWLSAMADVTASGTNSADTAFWRTWQAGGASMLDRARHAAATADDLTLLTLPAPGLEPFDARRARYLATHANDQLAEVIAASRGRMAGLATVAAFDAAAAREAERAIRQLGLAGISLGANRGLRLDHHSLRPIYEFANAARVPIYLPAAYAPQAGETPYRAAGRAGVITGAAADSGNHATQLIFGGVLDAYPSLIVVIARLGEGAPYWYGTVQDTYAALKNSGGASPKRPAHEYFRDNILLTTSGMSADTLQYCSAMLGNGRVLWSREPSGGQLLADAGRAGLNVRRLTGMESSSLLRSA